MLAGWAVAAAAALAQGTSPVTKNAAPAASRSAFSYAVEPAPAWVVPARERASAPVDRAPMHYRVIDEQLRVDAKSFWEYSHVVRVANEAAGLSTASQIEIEFDPSYQALVLHHLEVVRDGKHLNRLDRKRIQLLQRETQLERQMYDGRVTMSVVLDDVRAGDQIDFAYSIRGANPVFGGRFVHRSWMSSYRGPVALYQVRLLAPAERRIQYRTGSTEIQVEARTNGAQRETVFRREAVPQLLAEANAAIGTALRHQVQFSEFADWSEVARWGDALFSQDGGGKAIEQKARELQARSSSPQDQLLAALEFVQKDVRYFGTEIGPNTHQPAPPDKVMEQRFGDCKDKVTLLVALLRRMNIAAAPALVSTFMRNRVDQALPSPLDFDHVIARVELGGQTYWLDPTRTHQTGAIEKRQSSGFGRGLVLKADSQALAELPSPFDAERVLVKDTLRIERLSGEPRLESRITYRGDLAEVFRELAAARGLHEVANTLAAPYLRIYPKIRSTAPIRVEASTQEDEITFVQEFSIPEFWRFPEQKTLVADVVQWGIIDALSFPKMESRRDAYAFGYPGVYRHAVALEFAEDVFSQSNTQRFDDGDAHFRLSASADAQRRRVDYLAEVRIGTDQVEPESWGAYTAKVRKVLPAMATAVTLPPVPIERYADFNREQKNVEEGLRSGKLKAVTGTQARAWFRIAALTSDLEGGRLDPVLQAQAFTARGIQHDHLGQFDEARKDFARSLELAPDVDETHNAAATNALLRNDFAQALDFSERVLRRNPNDEEALRTRALVHYFGQDAAAARGDFDALLKRPAEVRRGYPLVWLSMLMRRSGQDPAALQKLYTQDALPREWPRPLVDFAMGRSTQEAVIQSAKAEKNAPELLCEAYFYIAEKYLAEGDEAHAREFWRKSVEQGVVEFIEDSVSRLRLAGLRTR